MSDANLYFSRDTKVIIGIGSNYWEIPVLDGYSFSQAQNASEVTLSEMESSTGTSRRGRRMFNDSYAPAEWSFSTYVRPFVSAHSGYTGPHATSAAASDTAKVHAVEEVLWGLFAGHGFYDSANGQKNFKSKHATPASGTPYTVPASGNLAVDFAQSNTVDLAGVGADVYFVLGGNNPSTKKTTLTANTTVIATSIAIPAASTGEIQKGDVCVITDGTKRYTATVTADVANGGTTVNLSEAIGQILASASAVVFFDRAVTYKLDGAVVDSASIDFDIDGIATINWSGMAKTITQTISPKSTGTAGTVIDEGSTDTTNFIRNRLSTLGITSTNTLLAGGTSTTYNITLTGGNVTFSNNMSFLTPETLGSVNKPFKAVAGTRSITGNFTCYLNTGTQGSNELFKDLVAATTVITNKFDLSIGIGGATAATNRLTVDCANVHLELPTHSIDDVISVDTSFHALPSTISLADEATVTYKV
jgi:hypothetical protein